MISCNSQQIIRLQLYCILSSLLLIVPLSFTAKSKEVTIFGSLQQDLNITCPLKEIHSLIWSIEKSEYNLDRKIIRPNHKYILHRCNNCSNRIANVLQINSVTEDDERVYACYSTDKQSIKFKLQLIVPISGVSLNSVHKLDDDNIISGVVNQPLEVICSVTKSRPSAFISVNVERSSRKAGRTKFEPLPLYYRSTFQADGSFSSQLRFKAESLKKEDDLSNIVCETSLFGLSKHYHNIKVSKTLRVYYPPECSNTNEPVFIALNRSNFITCPILKANPPVNAYSWQVGNHEHRGPLTTRTIEIIPHLIEDIHSLKCIASNGIEKGVTCKVEIALGGKPDPVTDCHWSFPSNNSLQIVCKLGFHQGDRNQQCVLYKQDEENDLMSEYARSQKCSFLIDSTSYDEPQRLKVFSLNKFGDSLQHAVSIELNTEPVVDPLQVAKKKRIKFSILMLLVGVSTATLLLCCWYGRICGTTSQKRSSSRATYNKNLKSEKSRQMYASRRGHNCYSRRTQNDLQIGEGSNLLLPLVNNGSEFCSSPDENGSIIVDSSVMSSYLVPRDSSPSVIMRHSLPDTPPPVTPRSNRTNNAFIQSKNLSTVDEIDKPPLPSPRKSSAGNYEIKYAKSIKGIGSMKVTNC